MTIGRGRFPGHRRPFRIRRVLRHTPIKVRRSIGPPHWSAFTQRDLGGVHRQARGMAIFRRCCGALAQRTTRAHQLRYPARPLLLRKAWITRAPEPPAHQKVPAIGRHWVTHRLICQRTPPPYWRLLPVRLAVCFVRVSSSSRSRLSIGSYSLRCVAQKVCSG